MDIHTTLSDSLLGGEGIAYQQQVEGFPATGGNSKIFSLENSTEALQSQTSTTVHSPVALEDSFMGLGNGARPDYNSLMEANENLRSQLAQYQQLLMFLQQQAIETKAQELKFQPYHAPAAAAATPSAHQAQVPLDNDALVLLDDDEYPFPRWTVTESTVRPYPVCVVRYNGPKSNLLVKVTPAPGYDFKTENHIAYYKAKDQTYLAPRNVGDIIVFELLHVEEVGNADGEQIQFEFSLYNIEGTTSTLIARKISSPITVFNHSQYLPAPSITKLMPSWASAGGTPKVDAFGPLFLRKNNILECQVAESDGTEYKLYTGTAIERKRNCFHAFAFTAPSHPAGKVVVRCRYRGRDFGAHRFFEFIQSPVSQGPRGASTLTARGNPGELAAFAPVAGSATSAGAIGPRGPTSPGQHYVPGGMMGYACANDVEGLTAAVMAVSSPSARQALVNFQDPTNGTTALFWASFLGHQEVVETLLNFGALADLVNHRGDTALHAACYAGHDQIVKILLQNKTGRATLTKRDYVDELTPLHIAAYMGQMPTLMLVCEQDDSEDMFGVKDRDGMTPLHTAVLGQHVEAVKYLVDMYNTISEDLNVRDSSYMTPLAWACALNNTEIAYELLPHLSATEINVFDENRETPLFHAVRNNNLELARELCVKGASPKLFDRNRRTPMFISVREKNNNITMLLLEHGADPSHADIRGHYPFGALDMTESQLEGSRITASRVAEKIYDRVAAAVKPLAEEAPPNTIIAPINRPVIALIPGTDTPMPASDRPESPVLPPTAIIPFEITPSYGVITTGHGLTDSDIREVAQLTTSMVEAPIAGGAASAADSTETPGNPALNLKEPSKLSSELAFTNEALSHRLKAVELRLQSTESALKDRDSTIARLMEENRRLAARLASTAK